jgi:hypothetical protein
MIAKSYIPCRCSLCPRNAPSSLQKDLRRINEHIKRSHKGAQTLTSTEGLECCLAGKPRSNSAFIAIDDSPAKDVQEDFRSESTFEMKIGFLKQDIILATGELLPVDGKSFFYHDTALPNPWYDKTLAFLQTGKGLCNEAGASLCRQLCMRDSEGKCSHKSFAPVQMASLKKYASNVADLIWFATKCPWETLSPDLSSVTSILKSILFEPYTSIQQTFMIRL